MNEHTQRLINAELSGELGPDERDELMQLMMDDPDIETALKHGERAIFDGLAREQLRRGGSRWLPDVSWLANAASLTAGVGLTLLALQFGGDDPQTPGTVSASVHYLETVRSATPQLAAVEVQPDEAWITLIADAGYTDVDALNVRIAAYIGEPDGVFHAEETAWQTVWQQRSPPGNRDSLAITLPSTDLPAGIYRLTVEGVASDPPRVTFTQRLLFEARLADSDPAAD
jgi:hypothetical protein